MKTLSKIFGIIAMAAGIAALGFEIKSSWDKIFGKKGSSFNFEELIASTNPDDIINGGDLASVTTKISFWDKAAGTISSVTNTISTAAGLSSLTTVGSAVGGSSHGGLANDLSSRLKCMGGVWWKSISVGKTLESAVSMTGGQFLMGSALFRGRFLGKHALKETNPLTFTGGLKDAGIIGGAGSIPGAGGCKLFCVNGH